jgi:HlyD family secretion protein
MRTERLWVLVLAIVGCTTHAEAHPAGAPVQTTAERSAIRAEGQVVAYPGADVTVGSEVMGRIVLLPVKEKSVVRKGDVIALLDASENRAALAEARAHIAESAAELMAADTDVTRAERLAATHAVSQQELDHTRRDRDAAIARRDAAVATVARLEATVAKARIVAPISGVVTARLVEPGEIVSPGTSLVTIADLSRTRIEAEVDEYDVGRIAIGTTAAVSAEGYGDRTWAGRVEEIPDAVVGRRLKPQDPGKPTDTRVLLVKIALSDRMPFKLGQRVEVAIGAPATAD